MQRAFAFRQTRFAESSTGARIVAVRACNLKKQARAAPRRAKSVFSAGRRSRNGNLRAARHTRSSTGTSGFATEFMPWRLPSNGRGFSQSRTEEFHGRDQAGARYLGADRGRGEGAVPAQRGRRGISEPAGRAEGGGGEPAEQGAGHRCARPP